MRAEIIRCDTCTKEHDAQYMLPREWVVTEQSDRYDGENMTHHFCSKTCLIKWASIGIASCDIEIMVDAIRNNGEAAKQEREQKLGKHNPACNEVMIEDAQGNVMTMRRVWENE